MEDIKQRKYFIVLIFSSLALLFVSTMLLNFHKRIQEREYNLQLSALEDLSVQENAIVENKLEGYIKTLESVAGFLGNGELHTEDNLNLLYDMAQETDFQRIGIADINGTSKLSNGKTLNISDRQYFKKCLKGESVITESRDSYILNMVIFIVAVPVFDRDGEVKGVLYGVIETNRFHLYEETEIEKESKYIHIVDRNGNFIMQEDGPQSIIKVDNLFDALGMMETQIPKEVMISNIKQGKSMVTEVRDGDQEKIAYFYPLKINNWYIITVLDKKYITDSVDYLLGSDVVILTIGVIGAVLALCVLILHYSAKEKKKILELNEKLKFNDEMFKIASSKSDITILLYDVKSRQLKFVSKGAFDFDLPPVIENLPQMIMEYVPDQKEARLQMENLLKSLGNDEENGSFYITLQFNNEIRYFYVQVSNLFSEKGKIAQCVGLLKEITEEMQLRKEVKFRETLLSNTIGFMEIDLDKNCILHCSEDMLSTENEEICFDDYMECMLETKVLPEYRDYIKAHLSKEMLRAAFERGVQDSISEFQCYGPDGNSFWIECEVHLERDREQGHIKSYHIMRNINDKKREELRLREEADIDHLTGLYNRRSGSDKINKILADTDWKLHETYACMVVDLDNFKTLNDTLGHQMGDKALRDVGGILRRHFRPYDIVCRIGGDEFLIFVSNIPEDVIGRNVNSLLKKMYLEYSDGNRRVQISASIGIALAPVHGTELQELYRKADLALYETKHHGKAGYQVYEC